MSLGDPFDPIEIRVLGVLMEKEVTTPDQYPLSLNALVNACNQKSNRNPVMSLDESTVQQTLDGLRRKHLVLEKSGFGSRVAKYQHRFCNTEFSDLRFTDQEKAIVCELFIRGAQTPGELRARASRMASLADVREVETALQALQVRESGPLVRRLPREPGKREARYIHLFGDTAELPVDTPDGVVEHQPAGDARSSTLEQRLEQLESVLEELRSRVAKLEGDRQ
jgi:hypothetical protein